MDIIVSEWMGYILVYDCMLLLVARDHWLKPVQTTRKKRRATDGFVITFECDFNENCDEIPVVLKTGPESTPIQKSVFAVVWCRRLSVLPFLTKMIPMLNLRSAIFSLEKLGKTVQY